MRVFAILVALLLSPLAAAISDLSIYSEAKYSSQSDAPILVAVSYTHLTLPTIYSV